MEHQILKKIKATLFLAALAFMPIKLAACYVALIPVIGLYVWENRQHLSRIVASTTTTHRFFILILLFALVSVFGANPHHSLTALSSLAFYALLIPVTSHYCRELGHITLFKYLLLGQAVAAIHSVLSFFIPALPGSLVGTVSESGQLAMTTIIAIALAMSDKENKLWRYIAPILIAGLLFNLKRGPWCGVAVGLFFFFWFKERRLAWPAVTLLIIAIFITPALRERLLASYNHLIISGGRLEMWALAKHMFMAFPLGIGYDNSHLMHEFMPQLPDSHRHFHNNIVNLAVEGGLLVVLLYLHWLLTAAREVYNSYMPPNPLNIAILAALLAWQVAGFVEYNFGDSEVILIAFVILGIGVANPALNETQFT